MRGGGLEEDVDVTRRVDARRMADAGPIRFDFGVRLGLVFIVETACLSAAAVTGLLAYIAVRPLFDLGLGRVSFATC